ncbi:restriction endonuclease subunit S [Rhizobium sp. G187]|uniref:restriction endonuclease subunit S n=1 Tax=Rhizobium sp. G187 TaxID=3451352 RepID=UPI003EE5F254
MTALPRGWVEATFADISEIKLGKMLDKEKNKGQLRPYLRNVNVRWDRVALDDILEMRFTDDELEPFGIRDGDLLVCEGGEPGRCTVWQYGPTDLKFQKALMRLRPYGGVEATLLAKALRLMAQNGDLQRHFTGTTIKHLPQTALASIPLPLPPLAEQKRIEAKLDALNAKSARARTELARIETLVSRYKQAVLSKAFSGELTREWRHDRDWPAVVRLGDVAGSFAYGSAAKSQKSGSIPVLRMGNIQTGKLDWADLVYTDDKDEIEKYRLVPGDVLFNRTNSPALVGKTAMYDGERDAIFAGYLIRIVAGPDLDARYLTYALNSPFGREFSWNAKTDGVSQSNISASKLKEFAFAVPPLEEQHEIVRRIESAFAKIDRLAKEAKRALELVGRLDEAILAKAFRGELVPQDENDEPAEHLLARIRAEREAAPKGKRGRGAKG